MLEDLFGISTTMSLTSLEIVMILMTFSKENQQIY